MSIVTQTLSESLWNSFYQTLYWNYLFLHIRVNKWTCFHTIFHKSFPDLFFVIWSRESNSQKWKIVWKADIDVWYQIW